MAQGKGSVVLDSFGVRAMSRYLIRRIEETPNIVLLTHTTIEALEGDGHFERVTWRDGDGVRTSADIRHVFLVTGAIPNTAWLRDCVAQDRYWPSSHALS